eukprot:COSAG02_NODE_24020_length_700_cov_1.189684_1_plen_33_part_10
MNRDAASVSNAPSRLKALQTVLTSSPEPNGVQA